MPNENERTDVEIDGGIEFKHVSFSYPNHSDKDVIKDLSFKCKPG